jgi:hypothetical protein
MENFDSLQVKEGDSLLMDVKEVQELLKIGETKTYEIIRDVEQYILDEEKYKEEVEDED